MIRSAAFGIVALGVSACAGIGDVDPAAPGGWFWFQIANPEERVAFYRARCDGTPGCVESALRQAALQSCRTEALRESRDEQEDRLDELRDEQILCANRLLRAHGVRIR